MRGVPTADQDCEMELQELRQYDAVRKWKTATEYVDQGRSGAKANRPELNALLRIAVTQNLDTDESNL